MKTAKEVHEFLMGLPNTKLDFPFGDDVAVYKVFVPNKKATAVVVGGDAMYGDDKAARAKDQQSAGFASAGDLTDGDWKMYALVPENKHPVSISLKCDPTLAKVIREKYESVMEGYHLNKKHWNTMLLTGQLEDQEVKDFILHSYNLVTKTKSALPDYS